MRGRLNSHVKAKSGSSMINKVRNSIMAEMDAPELNIIPDNRGTALTRLPPHLLIYDTLLGTATIMSPRTSSIDLGPGQYICGSCGKLNDSTINHESTLACYNCAFRKGGEKNRIIMKEL